MVLATVTDFNFRIMRIETFKTTKSYNSVNNRSLKIQSYGGANDLPQKVMEIISASVTGSSCLDTYRKFIVGRGFNNEKFAGAVVNSKGDTADAVLKAVAGDYAEFGGFAIHVNYNALGEIVSVSHVPFENVRFESLDDDYRFDRLAVHPDWGKRNTSLRRFRNSDIEFFHIFNPDLRIIVDEVEEAGGWAGYKGQILYFSNAGDKVYPMPIYEAALTDMSNEEGLSNITHRNVRSNFLPAGMLIDRNNPSNGEDQDEETKEELSAFQGDMNAGKMMYINLQGGEEAPEFKPFEANNTDSDFEKAESKTPQIIGRAFCQPPILRSEDVGSNFGSDLMRNAYDFYNAQTESERQELEKVFKMLFGLWYDQSINSEKDFSISPKVYRVNQTLAERLGSNTDKVLELIFDSAKPEQAKKVVLECVYGLDDEDITKLMEGVRNAY